MNDGRPGVMFYFDKTDALEKLPHDKVGVLFLAAMRYAKTSEEPKFDDALLNFAWALIRPSIDRDAEKYEDKRLRGEWLTYCRKCKQDSTHPLDFETYRQQCVNGTLRAETSTQPTTTTTPATSTTTATDTATNIDRGKTRQNFTPPTLEEVQAYKAETQSPVDPQDFIDFYAAKGWNVGKTKMKDWRAAFRRAASWDRYRRKSGSFDITNPASYEGGTSL